MFVVFFFNLQISLFWQFCTVPLQYSRNINSGKGYFSGGVKIFIHYTFLLNLIYFWSSGLRFCMFLCFLCCPITISSQKPSHLHSNKFRLCQSNTISDENYDFIWSSWWVKYFSNNEHFLLLEMFYAMKY